ncbi:DUF4179 domain-containing protein [Clostridium sp. LIBA-8841]|uniref:DUF4179 domain-containing protein n=1 Tax=Clostridium sp. LIBA-8841 TaxID=2987530 RepID=UPI002AC6CE08|nr:DUF4179 domain-containing protein [Clostridium sp. LIBA-8841]MDZ5254125.1 DUF4179 domain-containing protein [Clostridium sp. LIBA-8841]
MKNIDDLFDREVKNKLKMENSKIPEDINKKMDEAINNLGKRKRNYKKVSGICAACIVGTLIFGVTMPTYAQNIPVIGKIFEIFNGEIYENYDKYASDLDVTKESNGYRVTINKIVYDTIDLEIFYTIQSDKSLEDGLDLLDVKLEVNNKWLNSGFSGGGIKIDDFTYVGSKRYSVATERLAPEEFKKNMLGGDIKIPNNFNLSIDISSLGTVTEDVKVKGKWNFDIPISDDLVKENIKEQDLNINLGKDLNDTILTKLIQTPINTVLQVIQTKEPYDYSDLDLVIFDDKGKYLYAKGGRGIGHSDENGNSKMFYTYNLKEVNEESESLTIIPYIQRNDMNEETSSGEVTFPKELKSELNLTGESEVKLDNGEVYSKINKIENIENGTRVYYESKYSIYGAPNYIINNETGEKIEPIGNKEMGYADKIKHVSGNEFYIEFPKELKENDYTVVFLDRSSNEPGGDAIKIDLK